MIVAKFQNGFSVTGNSSKCWIVEQVAASLFVIKNPAGEIQVSNIKGAEKACKMASEISRKFEN